MVNEKPRERGRAVYISSTLSVSQSVSWATSLSRFSSPQESGSVCFPIALSFAAVRDPDFVETQKGANRQICNLQSALGREGTGLDPAARRSAAAAYMRLSRSLAPALRRIRDYQDQETSRRQEAGSRNQQRRAGGQEGRRAGGSSAREPDSPSSVTS